MELVLTPSIDDDESTFLQEAAGCAGANT